MSPFKKKAKSTMSKEGMSSGHSAISESLPPRWLEGLLLFGLIALTLGLFVNSLSADFTFDDLIVVVEDPRIHNWEFRSDPWYGWHQHIRALTYMIDYSLFGKSPVGWHVHNLLWHLISLILFYFLVKGITNKISISFAAALLFATHPIHVEVVTNITNRKELLCLAFMLASGLAYGRFLHTEGQRRITWLVMAFAAWILSLFSKQFAIALPLYLTAYEFLFLPQEKRFLLKNPRLIAGGVIVGLCFVVTYALVRAINLEDIRDIYTYQGYSGDPTLFSVAITSARSFWGYVGLLIWPDDLCPDRLVKLSQSFLEPPITLLSWVGLFALVAMAIYVAHRWPLLAFGVFCFLFSYLPISNLLPTVYVMADRYMYISSVGFCISVVGLGDILYQKLRGVQPRYAAPAVGVVLALMVTGYAVKTWAYNPHWKNEWTLWAYTLQCNPQSYRAYNNLGYQYMKAGDYPKAIELLSNAIKYGYPKAYEHRGSAFLGMKNYEAALQDYNNALKVNPDWDTIYYDRGLVYFQMEEYEKAIKDFTRAIELNPDYSTAFNNRGLGYENLNRREEALGDYVQATKLDPDNGPAYNNLGRALVYAGRLEEAIQSFQRAERLGVPQATKILEILNKKGLPGENDRIDPSGDTQSGKEDRPVLEPSMSKD